MMDSQTFKQIRFTSCSRASSLFTGDVFDMKGGKYENQDLRLYLQPYLDDPDAELLLINKPKDDEFGGFQTMALVSRIKGEPVTLYDPTRLIEEGHPLTRQQGHKTVSSFKDTNRLWNGKFVIEYDLVDCDKRGKKYLFMDGVSLSEATSVRKDNEDDSYFDDALDTDDEEFVSTVKRRIDPYVLNADKGPIVSGSTLLTEIKILAELFKEETESEEKTGGLDPVIRKLLLPKGFPEDKPMFDVAFLTNVMTMGFKAVFYPTALDELSSSSEGVDVVKLNALLAAQTELLVRAMPRIVASVNRTLSEKKCVKYFKFDAGGTKNLSLPANVKADELAMPYHQFKVHENGVVEISNKELVTSLGVKKRPLVKEWLNELGVFERKCKYAASIGRGGDKLDNNEWRRKLLFSRIADTLPFKYRTDFIDLDYYVSGLCFSFLSSEYGMSIDYDPEFVTSVINHPGGSMTMDERSKVGGGNIVGYSSSEVATEGSSSTAECQTRALLTSNDIARSRAPPNPLPLPSDVPKRIYESLLGSNKFYKLLPLLRDDDSKLGMITVESSEEYASVIIKLLTAKTKKERKYIADSVFKRKMLLIRSVIDQGMVDMSGEGEYYMAVAYAILQMVIRYIIRDRGVGFESAEFNQTLSNMKWAKLDFDHLWKSLYMESINKPSPEMDEATAAKYTEASTQEVDRSVHGGDRLMEIIDEINDVRETEEIVALRNKTVETIGDGHDCYPFASSAYGHDTMFLWTVVTLAERFCQLYNAVNNPEEYYRAMISEENKLSFEGGEENFKRLCSRLKSELQIFLCSTDGNHTFVCRQCVEKSEREFETNKNRVNKELLLIKKKELEMSTPSITSVPIARESMTPEEVYRYKADTDKLCRDMFDVILEVEAEAAREEEGEECSSNDEDYESCGEDDAFSDEEPSLDMDAVMKVERKVVQERLKEDVINGFFNRYAEVRSFRSRSALCHRQEYISVSSLLVMDKLLSGYVVTPKIVKYQDDHARILEEVRSRSKRGKGWVVPYTFPVDKITGSSCCCCCKGGVKLLVVPDSSSVRQLTTALRFNTMACERRFFTDVSTSLGFVPQTDAHPQYSSSFFFNTVNSKYCDFYENIIKVQENLRSCLLPRFRARYAAETYDSSMKNLEDHASFFAGLWAICAKANLENTVLSAVVSCPQEASYTLKGNSNAASNDSMAKHVARAVEAIGSRKQTSIVKTFLEFVGCVNLVSMNTKTTTKSIEADQDLFLKLVNTYKRPNDCNGTHLWTLFSVMKRCFDNSLPLDWPKLLDNNRHLNLVPNAPNTDESGALFETTRFISRCSELILGKTRRRLKECITREEWRDLLTGNGWASKIALVYEKVMNTSDSRTTENFINSSTFLSNNNVSKKICINETKNEKIRQACWSSGGWSSLSVDERIDLLMAVERTNRDMTLSTVIICCALYRLLVEGCRVEDITNKESENVDRFIPFLKSLSIVTATWNSSGGGSELNPTLEYNTDNLIEVCAKNGRFVDIENDPVFFYRFAAYTLGMLANNDQFFEDLTGIITESFDFNGVDTRNWNDFIEKHFLSLLLGRRAFLISRPSAFIKRMIGSSNDKNNSESVRRLAKLMMVKAVDANDLTLSDLVLCCIEDDGEDFVVRSAEEYQNKFYRFGKKTVKKANATESAMSSNACSNEQMSKKVKASRPLDVRVYFNKKSGLKVIERNEEEEVDLSYGLYTDTVEKAVIKPERGGGAGASGDGAGSGAGGGDDDSSLAGERKRKSRQRNNQARENDTKNFNGRTEDIYDHSSREDTSGTMSGFIAASNSMDGSAFMREKDVKFRKDSDFTENDLIIANDNIVKCARKLMRQDKIKEGICQMIDSMSDGLKIVCPFNNYDDPSLLGLSRTAANRVIDTLQAWNAIVAREAAVFKEECKEIEKSCTYDMRLVLCGDYTSEGISSGFGDEVHVFKTPLFDIVSAEGKRKSEVITSKAKKKKYDEESPPEDRDSPEPLKDAVRTVNSDTLDDIAAFKKNEESNGAYRQRFIGFGDGPQGNGILFKQRLHGDRILDPSLVAHFFSSNLIDPYMRSVVPRLMQHNAEHEGKVWLKRPANASEKNGDGSEGDDGKKKGGDDRVNMFAFSSLNIIRTNSDLSRLKQCANENNSNLVSLYDNVSREQQVNGVSDIITKEDVRIPIRRGTVNGEEEYASVKALWLCNSGIHPRDQIEMFKKMVFRNYNKIWIKIYSEAMNVFRKWGVLTKSTIDRPFFSVKFTTMPVQVVDNNPPNAVLHSKFLSKDALADRVSASNSMVKLREYYSRSVGMTNIERFRNVSLENINADVLDRAILCREFMTSLYDDRGLFATSKFTNAATFVFTPGTSVEGRDYRGMGHAKDEDFVGKEEVLCTNAFNMCYGRIVSALRYGVFEDTTSKSLEGGRNRVLRLYDNDMVLSSKSGSVNVIGVSSESSKRKSDSIMKRAAKDTIKDSNHTTRVKHSVYGHLTTHYSVINDNYNARNMLMSIKRVDRAAATIENKSDEEKNKAADDLSLRYILGRYRGHVFYEDDFPSERKRSNHLTLLKKCFGAVRDRNVNDFAIFSKEWLVLSIVPEITRSARMASKIKSCIRIDRRIDVGADITFDDLAPKNESRNNNSNLRRSINRSDASVGFEKRGVSFLANPVVSMRWFLMRAHHLRLSCTNFGVASLSNFMGNRENKSTPMDVPPSAKSLATVFKMKTARNSCISVDNNRFFLIGGSYVLGGRLEGVNLITDMFVRCRLQTEKQIVHEVMFDTSVTTAFLAACMEGTAITRGVSMIEHISRLTNVTAGDSKSKNFWSLSSPHNREKEETQFEYCYAGDASPVVRPPSVCIDDDNYVFLRMLYSVVSEMEDKKRGATAPKVDKHVAAAIKKSYVEVLNQKNGLPNMHSLFHLRSIMNFCGFVHGICTGDGEKAHHLMHTLSAVGINMTPKTILAFIGVIGNNLKSSLVNIVKARWWDMYTDLSADALVGKGDSSSTDAKFAYVAGKKNIFIMEEVGYQGSVKEKKSGAGRGSGCADATEDKTSFLDSINSRNVEVASNVWDRVSKRLKDNNIRLFESQTVSNGSLMAPGKKQARDEEEDSEKEEAMVAEPEEEVISFTEKRTNDKKKKDNKSPMINMFSNKVGWWSHIKGPVFSEIGRDKAISCIISNSEVPFCTLSKNIIDNSPWVRETDSILVNHRDIENKITLYTPILTPPTAMKEGGKDNVGGGEDMDDVDLISASASSSSSSYLSALNASEIKEKCLNLIKKDPSNNSFRPFSKMKELLMSVGYNEDNEWFIDENRRVLTPRRTSAGEAAANAANASICPAIFAMHAFSPSNYSQGIVKGFRRYYLDEPGEDVNKRIGFRLSKPRKAAKAMYSDHQLKQTTEQTIAHIINFPNKYSFPVMTVDGSELFPIKPEASSRIVEKFVRLNKTNLGGGKICKEIAAISELASSSSSNGQQQSSSSVFLSPDSFNINKGIYETNGTDVDFLDLMRNTGSHKKNINKLNVIERTFAAALENRDNSKTDSNVALESNLASSKMNRDSPFTEERLPGQVSSNLVKQIASTDAIMSVRGLHGRPITCSVSATPVMISNSFLLRYYVDTAMYKRMLIFPFDTNFASRNVEPNVELGDKIVRSGLKVIHASLLCKRSNVWSTNNNKKYTKVLKKRVDEWNDLTGCCYGLDQVDSLVSLFPSVFLKHVMKTKVLELSDNSDLIKLEEACNTFFQSHASIMLSSRPNTLIKEKRREEEDVDDDEQAPSHKQICTINSKTMNTLQACIDRAKSGGVWGLVNSALRSVLFINAPFVDTKALYGEGCTVKMMLDDETSLTINMSSGLRLPDLDGIGRNGTIGIGDALMKQLVGSWGTANIKNSMYSCHHLHTMFELVMQETTIHKRLENVGDMSSDYMSNVAFLLISSVYIEMFERFAVFAGSGVKKMRVDVFAKEDADGSSTYPVFMSMIVNKSIDHLNSLTNLADVEEKNGDNGCHTRKIEQVLNVLGKRLNTMYLCPSCRDSM